MVFGFFSRDGRGGTEEAFWKWFATNERRLFAFEQDQEAIFDELGREMGRVNAGLTFEFGPVRDGKREFVISAGGIKSAFPAVEAVYGKAPTLERWVWVKFRPRRAYLGDLEYEGKKISADKVHYLLAKDGDRVGIVLFFDGYTEEQRNTYGQIGYLFLDEALGEFAVETQVGFVEFHSTESKYFSQSSPLTELQAHFDEYWVGKVN